MAFNALLSTEVLHRAKIHSTVKTFSKRCYYIKFYLAIPMRKRASTDALFISTKPISVS